MNIPVTDHSRYRKCHRLLQRALATACVLTHAQSGPLPPSLIGTAPGTAASGDALTQMAALSTTTINRPSGGLGVGNVSMAVRLGTPLLRSTAPSHIYPSHTATTRMPSA